MPITAKELAKKLNLSATAVSMALNNKTGVSTKTRTMVLEAAKKYGYDFTKHSCKTSKINDIYFIVYKAHNAVMSYSPILSELTDGINQECQKAGYKLNIYHIYEKNQDVQKYIEDLRTSRCAGIILLGTEIHAEVCNLFLKLPIPIVLLDSSFHSVNCNSVAINNVQGAYLATDYLISRRHKQPGYLRSSYPIINFAERSNGFYKAIQENGMSASRCILHNLSPSIEGAFSDMLEIIDRNDELADCYFADNDFIAIGAIKALKLRGYRLPEDIAIIGFDNISESKIIEPALTSIHIPRQFMGQIAMQKLVQCITDPVPHVTKTEINTSLVKRFSV